jgi:hypothetical protein
MAQRNRPAFPSPARAIRTAAPAQFARWAPVPNAFPTRTERNRVAQPALACRNGKHPALSIPIVATGSRASETANCATARAIHNLKEVWPPRVMRYQCRTCRRAWATPAVDRLRRPSVRLVRAARVRRSECVRRPRWLLAWSPPIVFPAGPACARPAAVATWRFPATQARAREAAAPWLASPRTGTFRICQRTAGLHRVRLTAACPWSVEAMETRRHRRRMQRSPRPKAAAVVPWEGRTLPALRALRSCCSASRA